MDLQKRKETGDTLILLITTNSDKRIMQEQQLNILGE